MLFGLFVMGAKCCQEFGADQSGKCVYLYLLINIKIMHASSVITKKNALFSFINLYHPNDVLHC